MRKVPPYPMQGICRGELKLHSYPLLLQRLLGCHYPKSNATAPADFNFEKFVRKTSLGFELLRKTQRSVMF